jgi:SAM-dependent methyltransferase
LFDGKYLEWNQRRIKCIIDYYGHKFMYMKKLLDLGCGQADISGAMYRLGADVTAVDARQEHLTTASKKFQGIKTVKADVERGWPFPNRKFDIILDLALLCHIRDFQSHLASVCASTNILVLETAVCDSNDPNKLVIVDESKAIYDNSVNGVGCRPSAEAIEKVLTDCGMTFVRMDNARLNAGPFIYDWQVQNTGDISVNRRRLWFCSKSGTRAVPPSQLARIPQVENNSIFQPVYRQTALARPPGGLPPLMLDLSKGVSITNNTEIFRIPPSDSGKPRLLYITNGQQSKVCHILRDMGVSLMVFNFASMWEQCKDDLKISNEIFYILKQFNAQIISMDTPNTIIPYLKDMAYVGFNDEIKNKIIAQKDISKITYEQLKGLFTP